MSDKHAQMREMARDLIRDSAIEDAIAQKIAQIIEFIHEDRIKPLEAKLAKAVEAMQEAIKLADMPHYGDREAALDNCFDAIDLLRTTLAELKGDKP